LYKIFSIFLLFPIIPSFQGIPEFNDLTPDVFSEFPNSDHNNN